MGLPFGAEMPQQAAGLPAQHAVTLSVFMEGTGNPLQPVTTQIGLFSKLCTAAELSAQRTDFPDQPGHYKLSFDGCGVTHGLSGTIFASGLREQCALVKEYVSRFVNVYKSVKVNFVGLSRGGIGGLYLAQTLASFGPDALQLNMLLYDPVPGNFIWMARYVDCGGCMNANRCMDVSACRCLGHVLVLYPHEPLPSIAVHAPVLARFPQGCDLEQDVILGCHQGALWLRPDADTCLSFALIRDFLARHGSALDLSRGAARDLALTDEQLVSTLARELSSSAPTDRSTHSPNNRTRIVRRQAGSYLCRYHEALCRRIAEKRSSFLSSSSWPAASPGGAEGPRCPRYMLDFEGL